MWSKLQAFYRQVAQKITPSRWFEQQQTSILSAAVVITLANLCSSLAGLLRQKMMISQFFDTIVSQQEYEAFLVAFQIPDLLYQLIILGALSAAFIPVFTSLRKRDGQEKAFKMTSIVMNILLGVFAVVGLVVIIFAEQITIARTGANFTPEQVAIAVNLTRIMIFAQFFFAISNFFTGMLQSFQKFIMPAIAPIFYNVGIVLGTYLLYPSIGVYGAGVGVVLGAGLHMLIQWPQIRKLGFHHLWSFNWNFEGVKRIFKMMPARLMTVGITEIQSLGIGFFTTQIGDLSFVIISLAQSVITLPIRFFGVPIAQAALPFLSEQADNKDKSHFRRTIIESLNQISFLAVPASVLLLILRIPVIRLLFGTKNFPWSTTVTMGRVVAIIAISIAAQAIYTLLVRAFHALRDTWTPFILSIVVTILFFTGCLISVNLPGEGQIYGLALTISLAGFLEAGIHLLFLDWKVKGILTKDLVWPQLKIILAGIIMAASLYIPFKLLDQLVFDTTRVVPLIALTGVTGLVGLGVYILLARLLKIKEQRIIWQIVSRLNKKKLKKVELKGGEPIVSSADMIDEVM